MYMLLGLLFLFLVHREIEHGPGLASAGVPVPEASSMIAIVWFCLVAIMIAGYVVLDGFDLGAGIVHLFVARTDSERRQVLRSIGPVWDGNEVWLLAGGGTLYFAFPALYSAAFSGFYLALMMVLWLLILRGISIEFRSHIVSPVWGRFGIWYSADRARCSRCCLALRSATWCAVFRSVPTDSFSFRCGPISSPARMPASWTGTRS